MDLQGRISIYWRPGNAMSIRMPYRFAQGDDSVSIGPIVNIWERDHWPIRCMGVGHGGRGRHARRKRKSWPRNISKLQRNSSRRLGSILRSLN